ncbi:VPA1269 family protein [Burkholderia ubonensis]|uniref:VPA1269 family protein n=1 Tax=Burkholderia ubonensis TaxID=101571 RepID=UPI0009B5467B|nr:VPA1269 family protein [Burkholderia ubonensis]
MPEIQEFNTFGGGTVALNISSNLQIFQTPSLDQLRNLLDEFRSRQLRWLRAHLLSPVAGRKNIVGLSASRIKLNRAGTVRYTANLAKIYAENISEYAWEKLDHISPIADGTHITRIFEASIQEQQDFLGAALGDTLKSISELLKPNYNDRYIYSWLDDEFNRTKDPKKYIESIFERADHERKRIRDKRSFLKNQIPDLFIYWLCQNNIVLAPIERRLFIGESDGFEDYLRDETISQTWKLIESAYKETAKSRGQEWMPRLEAPFKILTVSSTLCTPDDVSNEMFKELYNQMDKRLEETVANRLHWIYRALRDSLGRPDLPIFRPVRLNRPTLENPFDWVKLSSDDVPSSTFPRRLPLPYYPHSGLLYWSALFGDYLIQLPVKSIGNNVSSLHLFLVWLLQRDCDITSIENIKREHINDGILSQDGMSFRAYISRLDITPESANGHILRLSSSFENIIERDALEIPNPFSVRFDSFRVPAARGKTPRRPMGRELLTFLKQVNSRDNYALSRGQATHYRLVLNGEGTYEELWFPGFAILIDLLLQLPLRSFQARYLDSGEGDEYLIANEGEYLTLVPNPLSTANTGRRESVFYFFEANDGSDMVGIYINTNKTSVDRESGYEIPWCSAELRDSLLMMLDWQMKHNPTVHPIPCMEKHEHDQAKNPDILEALKITFPLFRDPAERRGWPISRDKLFTYWSTLLAAAEDELSAEGRHIRLTEEKEVSKGPNKSPAVKRLALYDVHTLRVSGISALIEAGVAPDLVQAVAGHTTLVTTLYYNKIKASKLNESLSVALDKLNTSLDSIDGLNDEDFEELSQYLINSRLEEDSVGHELLRQRMGHGDGAIEVFSHGICAGGECATGGEYQNQAVGYGAVPRPLACSLCRYRLTGPMFITGLILNANRLMHELRTKGKEIARLNEELAQLSDARKPTHVAKAQIEALYRETDIVASEWAAEIQYVFKSESLFERYLENSSAQVNNTPILLSGTDGPTIESRIGEQSEFALLQNLVEGAVLWPGFKPTVALNEHREFLNEVLAASGVEPFLLKLRGDVRDRAALLLGRVISSLVPDDHVDNLRTGVEKLSDFPSVAALVMEVKTQMLGNNDARLYNPSFELTRFGVAAE